MAQLGLEAKLYLNDELDFSGDYTEITSARDVTLNMTAAEADVTSRGSGGWRAILAGLKDASVDFDIVYDTSDTTVATLRAAYFNKSKLAMAVMDGPIATAGSQGLKAVMSVLDFSRNEPLEEGVTVSVSVKPAPNSTAPSWLTVSA